MSEIGKCEWRPILLVRARGLCRPGAPAGCARQEKAAAGGRQFCAGVGEIDERPCPSHRRPCPGHRQSVAVFESPTAVSESPTAVSESPTAGSESPHAGSESRTAVSESPPAVSESAYRARVTASEYSQALGWQLGIRVLLMCRALHSRTAALSPYALCAGPGIPVPRVTHSRPPRDPFPSPA